MPNLNEGIIKSFPLSLPSIQYQRRVAATMSAMDDKIELNGRINETLEALAQAIFRNWFVDFAPVRRKLAGERDPVSILGGLTPDPARASELAALFPVALNANGAPEGWGVSTVDECCHLTMGQSPPGSTYNEMGDGLPFFQGRTDFGRRYPSRRLFCSAPTRTAEADDTLVSVRAPVGDINMASERCCIGRGVAAVRHRSGSRSFTYYLLRSMQPALEQFENTGTVFGAIGKVQFQALETVAPPENVVHEFEAIAGPLDDLIKTLTEETRTLIEARDYLLPRLMSGKLRLADLEAPDQQERAS